MNGSQLIYKYWRITFSFEKINFCSVIDGTCLYYSYPITANWKSEFEIHYIHALEKNQVNDLFLLPKHSEKPGTLLLGRITGVRV